MDRWDFAVLAVGLMLIVANPGTLMMLYVLNGQRGWWDGPFEARILSRLRTAASREAVDAAALYRSVASGFTPVQVRRILARLEHRRDLPEQLRSLAEQLGVEGARRAAEAKAEAQLLREKLRVLGIR